MPPAYTTATNRHTAPSGKAYTFTCPRPPASLRSHYLIDQLLEKEDGTNRSPLLDAKADLFSLPYFKCNKAIIDGQVFTISANSGGIRGNFHFERIG